jgi:undecaprenyl-diphosphatase
MRRAERALPPAHAVALGLLQGPTELLPVSSSAHTSLLPWFAGWNYQRLDAESRKSFELALHAGATAALALSMRRELAGELSDLDGERLVVMALSMTPPVLAGLLLRGPIERHLGGPRSIAAGLLAGSLAMALAEALGQSGRERAQAGASDGLALGLAQAFALIPGVSRSGATLSAARARGFSRGASHSLSWAVALPLLLGASAAEGARLLRSGPPAGLGSALGLGAGAAFLSTLASAGALRRERLRGGSLIPFAVYRCLLAAQVLRRLRREGSIR